MDIARKICTDSFHSTPPNRRVESTSWNSGCLSVWLSVCHQFNISNTGSSNHLRIMSDPTYYTSLEKWIFQQWQWHWQRHTQWQIQRQRQSVYRDLSYEIFSKSREFKHIKDKNMKMKMKMKIKIKIKIKIPDHSVHGCISWNLLAPASQLQGTALNIILKINCPGYTHNPNDKLSCDQNINDAHNFDDYTQCMTRSRLLGTFESQEWVKMKVVK